MDRSDVRRERRPFDLGHLTEPQTVEELGAYGKVIDDRVEKVFARLTGEDLDRTFVVPKLPPWWDEDVTTSFLDTLLHIVEHELQHRAELNAPLRQVDVDPPSLDCGAGETIRVRETRPNR